MQTKDDDWIEHLFTASTHDYVLFFTSFGKVYRAKAYELPLGTREARGGAEAVGSGPDDDRGGHGDYAPATAAAFGNAMPEGV